MTGTRSIRHYFDLDGALEEIMLDSDSDDDFDPGHTEIREVDPDFDSSDVETSDEDETVQSAGPSDECYMPSSLIIHCIILFRIGIHVILAYIYVC